RTTARAVSRKRRAGRSSQEGYRGRTLASKLACSRREKSKVGKIREKYARIENEDQDTVAWRRSSPDLAPGLSGSRYSAARNLAAIGSSSSGFFMARPWRCRSRPSIRG